MQTVATVADGTGTSVVLRVRPNRDVDGRLERGGAIAGESEDQGTEDVHAMLAERAQPRDERLPHVVELLVHDLETFRCDSLDADNRT